MICLSQCSKNLNPGMRLSPSSPSLWHAPFCPASPSKIRRKVSIAYAPCAPFSGFTSSFSYLPPALSNQTFHRSPKAFGRRRRFRPSTRSSETTRTAVETPMSREDGVQRTLSVTCTPLVSSTFGLRTATNSSAGRRSQGACRSVRPSGSATPFCQVCIENQSFVSH